MRTISEWSEKLHPAKYKIVEEYCYYFSKPREQIRESNLTFLVQMGGFDYHKIARKF